MKLLTFHITAQSTMQHNKDYGWLIMEFLFQLIISRTAASPVVAAQSP